MKKNKKGFTIVELLAVVIIMAIIALIATPNILKMMEDSKKKQMIADARQYISEAIAIYEKEETKNNKCEMDPSYLCKLTIDKLEGEKDSPFGTPYDSNSSYVIISERKIGTISSIEEKIVLQTESDGGSTYKINSTKTELETNKTSLVTKNNNEKSPEVTTE